MDKVCKYIDGKEILKNVRITIKPNDKIVLLGSEIAKTTLLEIIFGKIKPDSGEIKYGTTVITSYFPKNNHDYFLNNVSMVDWLREYSENKDETFIRGFLGRMLFSGEEALKCVDVLSGGEKVRCMFSKMMLEHGNVLLFDEPTNHLDIESITALVPSASRFGRTIYITSYFFILFTSLWSNGH